MASTATSPTAAAAASSPAAAASRNATASLNNGRTIVTIGSTNNTAAAASKNSNNNLNSNPTEHNNNNQNNTQNASASASTTATEQNANKPATKKRRRRRTPTAMPLINLDGIRSVARPEQVLAQIGGGSQSLLPTGTSGSFQQADDFFFSSSQIEHDPVLQAQKSDAAVQEKLSPKNTKTNMTPETVSRKVTTDEANAGENGDNYLGMKNNNDDQSSENSAQKPKAAVAKPSSIVANAAPKRSSFSSDSSSFVSSVKNNINTTNNNGSNNQNEFEQNPNKRTARKSANGKAPTKMAAAAAENGDKNDKEDHDNDDSSSSSSDDSSDDSSSSSSDSSSSDDQEDAYSTNDIEQEMFQRMEREIQPLEQQHLESVDQNWPQERAISVRDEMRWWQRQWKRMEEQQQQGMEEDDADEPMQEAESSTQPAQSGQNDNNNNDDDDDGCFPMEVDDSSDDESGEVMEQENTAVVEATGTAVSAAESQPQEIVGPSVSSSPQSAALQLQDPTSQDTVPTDNRKKPPPPPPKNNAKPQPMVHQGNSAEEAICLDTDTEEDEVEVAQQHQGKGRQQQQAQQKQEEVDVPAQEQQQEKAQPEVPVRQTQHQPSSDHPQPPASRQEDQRSDIIVFLQSVAPSGSQMNDDSWASMCRVQKTFQQGCGNADAECFRKVRDKATKNGYVEWGRADEEVFGDEVVEKASPSEFDEAAEGALLQLTSVGRDHMTIVRVCHQIPRYCLNYNKADADEVAQRHPILNDHLLLTKIEMPFRNDNIDHFSSNNVYEDFSVELEDDPDDPLCLLLKMKGRKPLVDAFGLRLKKWIKCAFNERNFAELLRDDGRSELTVFIPREPFLAGWDNGGLQVVSSLGTSALWVDFSCDRDGNKVITLLTDHLGAAVIEKHPVVAIRRIEGQEYSDKKALEQLRQRFRSLKDRKKIQVTLLISGVNPEDVNKNLPSESRRNDEGTLPPVAEIEVMSDNDNSSLTHSVSRSRRGSKSPENGTPNQGRQNKTWHANQQFKAKYKPLYDIEYNRSDVEYQFSMSEMWSQHKQKYGSESCGDDCECALDIEFLTENVIERFISKHVKKNPTWHPPPELTGSRGSPFGFVNHFVPKALPMLLEQYPNDSPATILKRMTKMWDLHKKTKAFGMRCGDKCDCMEEGWKQVFFEGDVFRDLPVPRRGHQKRRSSKEKSTVPAVPRKRPRTESNGPSVASASPQTHGQVARQPSSLLPSPSTQHGSARDSLSVNTRKHGNLTTAVHTVERFSVSFDPTTPLGLYLLTERTKNSRVCTVASIDPRGACKMKNPHVQKGSRVETVKILQGRQLKEYSIDGHETLLRYYNVARNQKSELVICFNNARLPERSSEDSQGSFAEWTDRGEWCGQSVSGWAGGAPIRARRPSVAVQPPGGHAERPERQGNPRIEIPSRQGLTSILKRGHLARARVKPSPRVGRSVQFAGDKVHFSDHHSQRYFRVDTNLFTLEPESKFATKPPQGESSEADSTRVFEAVSRAVLEKSPSKLVHCLQTERVLAYQHQHNNRFLAQQTTVAQGPVKEILDIYKHADHVLTSALHLYRWRRFRVEVDSIVDLQLTELGEQTLKEKSVKCFLFQIEGETQPKKLDSLPPMDIANVIDYTSGNAFVPKFEFYYNPGETHQPSLHIEIHSTKAKMGPNITIPFNSFMDHLMDPETAGKLFTTEEFRVTNLVEAGLKMIFRVTRLEWRPEDNERLTERKVVSASKRLADVVKTIESFNHRGQGPALKAQICGIHGYSLLHAATTLAKPDLVQRLLKLGADPLATSWMGSAAFFGENNVHYASEKLEAKRVPRLKPEDCKGKEFDKKLAHMEDKMYNRIENSSSKEETIAAMIRKHAKDLGQASVTNGGFPSQPRQSETSNAQDNQQRGPAGNNASVPTNAPGQQGRGMGRGRASTLPAWMTRGGGPTRMEEDVGAHGSVTTNTATSAQRQSAPGNDVRGGGNEQSSALLLFLQCVAPSGATMTDEWASMCTVEKAFHQCRGSTDVNCFRSVRDQATTKHFLEWGRVDEEVFGDEVVEKALPSEFDEAAEGALLQLTSQGSDFLARGSQQNLPVGGNGMRTTVPPLAAPVCPNVESFLQGAFNADDDCFWLSMKNVFANFSRSCGKPEGDDLLVEDFKKWCESAGQDKLISWGRCDPSGNSQVVVCFSEQVVEHATDVFLRLTDKGRNVAFPSKHIKERADTWWHVAAGVQQPTQGSRDDPHDRSMPASNRRLDGGGSTVTTSSHSRASNVSTVRRGSHQEKDTRNSRQGVDGEQNFYGPNRSNRSDRDGDFSVAPGSDLGSKKGSPHSAADDRSFQRRTSDHSGGSRNHYGQLQQPAEPAHGSHPITHKVTDRIWFLPRNQGAMKREPCHHFCTAVKVTCRFGRKCHFAHIQPRLGAAYMDYWYANQRGVRVTPLTNVIYGERTETLVDGRILREYTAAYQEPTTNIFYHSEGGRSVCIDGLSFYPTREDAKAALEFSYAVSQPHYAEEYQHRRVA